MMDKFRQLTKNFFFKIILAFVAVSFVTFGISGFLSGAGNSWVVKIGDHKISYNDYRFALQSNRDMVLINNESDEALEYVNSEKFRSEVLSLMVKKKMFEIVHEEFGFVPDRSQVLKRVVKDPRFQDAKGNFDRKIFDDLLASNNIDESKYVDEVSRDLATQIIAGSLSGAAILNEKMAIEEQKFKNEERRADVIKINYSHLPKVKKPSSDEVIKFFEENKDKFTAPEYRSINYLKFSKDNFKQDYLVTQEEIREYYDQNREDFKSDEARSFYHILFDEKDSAEDFLAKLQKADPKPDNIAQDFADLAKKELGQEMDIISLKDITKKDFLPDLSEKIFNLEIGKVSQVIKSSIGFHLVLVNSIKAPENLGFAQVKEEIAQSLRSRKEEAVLDDKMSQIDDALLTSNSIVKVAKDFKLSYNKSPITIDSSGKTMSGSQVKDSNFTADFTKQSFALKEGQISKIFYNKVKDQYFAIQLEKIIPTRQKDLKEVKTIIVNHLHEKSKQNQLAILSKKIAKEVKKSPKSIARIAMKYKIDYSRNNKFPRIYMIQFQGREMPYQDQLLKDLFKLQTGEVTGAVKTSKNEFVIAKLTKVSRQELSKEEIESVSLEYQNRIRGEIMMELDRMLSMKYEVQVNRSLLKSSE